MRNILIFDTTEKASGIAAKIGRNFSADTASDTCELIQMITRRIPDAVIVNADLTSDPSALVKSIRKAAGKNIPAVFSLYKISTAAQEELCEAGADDIFVMPMCSRLMEIRLERLIKTDCPHFSCYEKYCDFDKLIEDVSEKSEAKGSFSVQQTDFANIYKFIARGLERSGKSVQALMLTLSCDEESEEQGIAMLSEAAKICLRKGDISSVCSRNQVVVLLIGADDNGGHLVANRIVSNFYSECDDDSFSLNYDIREVKMPPHTPKP